MTEPARPFAAALALDADWERAADALAEGLAGAGGRLGLLYAAEPLAPGLDAMTQRLRERTGAPDWVAAAGYGPIAAGAEHYGEAGAVALLADLPEGAYRLFAGGTGTGAAFAAEHGDWLAEAAMPLALAHVDPSHPEAMAAVGRLSADSGSFLVGGLAAGPSPHRAGGAGAGECLSGAAFSPAHVEVATGLSQGCAPLAPAREVTKCRGHVLLELDGRPALDVFVEDIGPELAADLRRCAGVVFAALPVPGSDTADYTVRNLVAIDPSARAIAIAEAVSEGDPVLFCRRDRESAAADMRRMAGDLARRVAGRPIRGGIYVSCAARGPNQFAPPERETDILREALGDFPMAGFFANGELSRDRVYAYTGVLTLFL